MFVRALAKSILGVLGSIVTISQLSAATIGQTPVLRSHTKVPTENTKSTSEIEKFTRIRICSTLRRNGGGVLGSIVCLLFH